MPSRKILLLGLSDSVAAVLSQVAAEERCAVVRASPTEEDHLLELVEGESVLAIVPADRGADRSIPARLAAARGRLPFVVVGERGGPAEWLQAVRVGARDYLEPPLGIEQIRSALRRAWRSAPMSRYVTVADAA